MQGFDLNWIDLAILLLLVGAMWAGLRIGFTILVCIIGGFFGALFLGGWLFPHLLPFHDRTLLTIINANLVLTFAVYAAVRGFDIGSQFHFSFGKGRLHNFETGLGVLLSTMAMLILVWLAATMIGRLPFAALSNSTNDAWIVQTLDRHLPAVPLVFAEFDRLINPNASPHLFLQQQPLPVSSIQSSADLRAASDVAGASTVRITSFGCGGIVSGSGFVIGPEMVATNAHVIAGVHRPIIKSQNQSYEGVPIFFDAGLDLTILRVKGLSASPLSLAPSASPSNTKVVVIGYAHGNYTTTPGIIRDDIHVYGTNIYGVGVIGRDVYELQTKVEAGDSGGPVVLSNGQVAGIVFAKSEAVTGYGYALTAPSLQAKLRQAENSTRRVNSGTCVR